MRMTFAVTDAQRLIFTEEAVRQMRAFAQHAWYQREAGGVLLGRYLLESLDVVVDEVTTPQGADKRSRFGFFRSTKHNRIAEQKWQQSDATEAYLGLWHTHPERDPSPSGVDLDDWSKAVSTHTYHGDRLFFPIIGTERIRVWTKTRTDSTKELSLLE